MQSHNAFIQWELENFILHSFTNIELMCFVRSLVLHDLPSFRAREFLLHGYAKDKPLLTKRFKVHVALHFCNKMFLNLILGEFCSLIIFNRLIMQSFVALFSIPLAFLFGPDFIEIHVGFELTTPAF